jgi:3-oxoacid CoA-transferase B subunit
MNPKELIARRIAQELNDGELVNLGLGLPTMVSNYINPDVEILLQSENGIIGTGPAPEEGEHDRDLINASFQYTTVIPGACFFDSVVSFGIIRGGHVNVTVLGTLEVDQEGNIANYIIPGKLVAGMGGAMDLCTGAKKVIIATIHTDKKGNPKILKKCRLPLTASRQANLIVTDLAFLERTDEGLVLRETAPGVTVEEVLSKTEAELIVPDDVGVMDI